MAPRASSDFSLRGRLHEPPHARLGLCAAAVLVLISGCQAFPIDPAPSDFGIRRSHDVLELMPALCPGEKVVAIRVTDFTDDKEGAVVWDLSLEAHPEASTTSGAVLLGNLNDLKVLSSGRPKTLMFRLATVNEDGKRRTNAATWPVEKIPTLSGNEWSNVGEEVVERTALRAQGCSDPPA